MSQIQLIQASLRLLAELGVREICVAAGARNAPILTALLNSQNIKLWNFFEERSAAFFALGRIQATNRPVAVLTTSGTAAAELLPAVIESHYQALPLIAFTADRPKSFRGTGAPQSIEQAHLFTPYTAVAWDLDLTTPIPTRIPVDLDSPLHLNLCLDEPLATNVPGIDFGSHPTQPHTKPAQSLPDLTPLFTATRPVVLAAGLTQAEASQITPFLLTLNAPILAEATSNLWSRSHLAHLLYPSSDKFLRAFAPSHVLRIGAVPTSRWWRDLEDKPDIPVINLSRTPFPGLARRQNVTLHPWSSLASLHATPCKAPLPPRPSPTDFTAHPRAEPCLLHSLQKLFTPGSQVFLGNSLPIREFNDIASPLPPDITFHANRGANGIDGLISTWLGLSANPPITDSWLILGDLSALYDLAAPWVLPQLPVARRFLVVVNNGGGKIFSRVPSLATLPDPARAFIENHHSLSFKPLADLWNLTHTLISDPSQLPALLTFAPGTHLIELQPDQAQTEAHWAASP